MPLLIFKALGILGFPSFQSLDLIEYEQVCSAFLNKLMTVMKNRKQAMMKAQEDRNKPKSQIQIQSRLRREKSWRVDVVMINEAFQVQSTVSPQIVSAETILGKKLFKGGNYSQKYGKLNLFVKKVIGFSKVKNCLKIVKKKFDVAKYTLVHKSTSHTQMH